MNESQRQDKICGVCGAQGAEGQRFCRQCGFEFPIEEFDEERHLRVALPDEKGSSCFSSLLKPVGVIGILLVLCFIIEEISHAWRWNSTRANAREKACYANMRVLLGAIEMYNMDNPVMISTIDETTEDRMVDGKYLKTKLSKPDAGCAYSSSGEILKDGKITCTVHGTVE
ncbi:MAG TPA: hypothetical protein PKM25_04880 [Candidatus Ozemobacteraceae bacterium]|mgnify:CR=1 FL=1|nr:hypothetical protein [Candidatus Ozemobacteraceae bacterium]